MVISTITAPKFEEFRALVAQAESIQEELATISEATTQLNEVKRRIGECLDETQASKLLAELRQAEELVLIKEIRSKRLTADLESLIKDAEQARRAARSEASSCLAQIPTQITDEFGSMLKPCQYENARLRDSRSLDDVVQTLNPMVIAERLVNHCRDSSGGYYQEHDPLERKMEVLKQSVARLQKLHDGREELAAESARLAVLLFAKYTPNAESEPCIHMPTTASKPLRGLSRR